MQALVKRLELIIEAVPERFNQFSDSSLAERLAPDKWSKKEILGHLCDSAANNHQRFVRMQIEQQPHLTPGYDQNDWVSVQDYQSIPGAEILSLWVAYNKHLTRVLAKVPNSKETNLCQFKDGTQLTFLELVEDYLNHLEHHLKQIFGTQVF